MYTVLDEAAFISAAEMAKALDAIPRRKGWITVHLLDGDTFTWNTSHYPVDVAAIAAAYRVPIENVEVS